MVFIPYYSEFFYLDCSKFIIKFIYNKYNNNNNNNNNKSIKNRDQNINKLD